jgi:hypothetical protein
MSSTWYFSSCTCTTSVLLHTFASVNTSNLKFLRHKQHNVFSEYPEMFKLSWNSLQTFPFLCCDFQKYNNQIWLKKSLQQPAHKVILVSRPAPQNGFANLSFLLLL